MSGLERYEGQDGGATLQCLDPPENTSESRDAWKEGLCHGKQALFAAILGNLESKHRVSFPRCGVRAQWTFLFIFWCAGSSLQHMSFSIVVTHGLCCPRACGFLVPLPTKDRTLHCKVNS